MTAPQEPNNQAHLPVGLSELWTPESLHAPPVRCSGWFGEVHARLQELPPRL